MVALKMYEYLYIFQYIKLFVFKISFCKNGYMKYCISVRIYKFLLQYKKLTNS